MGVDPFWEKYGGDILDPGSLRFLGRNALYSLHTVSSLTLGPEVIGFG